MIFQLLFCLQSQFSILFQRLEKYYAKRMVNQICSELIGCEFVGIDSQAIFYAIIYRYSQLKPRFLDRFTYHTKSLEALLTKIRLSD